MKYMKYVPQTLILHLLCLVLFLKQVDIQFEVAFL